MRVSHMTPSKECCSRTGPSFSHASRQSKNSVLRQCTLKCQYFLLLNVFVTSLHQTTFEPELNILYPNNFKLSPEIVESSSQIKVKNLTFKHLQNGKYLCAYANAILYIKFTLNRGKKNKKTSQLIEKIKCLHKRSS